ncbi:MAG: ABC transporter permease [bacterium]
MTLFKLTLRSTIFYHRAHALVLAGTLLASAIFVGSLLIGDSIKFSLTQSALLRLGNIQWALESRGRFFSDALAPRIQHETGARVAPALLFRGIALSSKGTGTEPLQINNIQLLGVQESFWTFAIGPKPTLTKDVIAINETLAAALQVQCGDQISIRFSKPSLMSKDAPLSSQEKNDTLRATFTVEVIVSNSQMGRFNLAANQQVPCTAFVSLPWLQQTAGLNHQANLLLAGSPDSHATSGMPPNGKTLNRAIRKVWQLTDAGLTLKTTAGEGVIQLECNRVLMDPPIGLALASLSNTVGALTYLVNSIARTDVPLRATPYSFVIALSPSADPSLGLVPPEMKDDEIIINRWLADQLTVQPGDFVKLSYYELDAGNKFIETNRPFKICRVVEMRDLQEEKELSPDFPGLTDAGKCTDWDIGMPLQKDKMEDPANETYWNEFRATPKALITLKAGQEMWANHFGNLTAARFHAHRDGGKAIAETVLKHLNPSDLGLAFLPVRQTALKAADESMDFGQLFLGMSFFLIVASLMLTGLLFAFGIQQRAEETGLMLAVGFQPRQIRKLWIQECTLIAATGTMAGALLGTYYTRVMIWGLSHFWQGAVAQAEIQYHATPATTAIGALMSFIFAMGSLIFAIRRQTHKSAAELLSGEAPSDDQQAPSRKWIPCVSLAIALGLVGHGALGDTQNLAAYFFASGCMLLFSILGLARLLLVRLAKAGGRLTPLMLGIRNAGRQPARSLTVASLLACGSFLVIAITAMQEDIGHDAIHRDSGTGGFALFGDSTFPIQADLNTPEGRKKFKLDQHPDLKTTQIVSMKVREGDDASCLNLNRAQIPTLIGVEPGEFTKRKAFQSLDTESSFWTLLDMPDTNGTIPGLVGDTNTAEWGLKKKTGTNGDILTFRDERGETFRVKLIGTLPMRLSVFQGSILISAQAFATHFPSESGTRLFLIDTPRGHESQARNALSSTLGKWGMNITSTTDRLKSFYAVESAYMAVFLVLGGLGMLLGSAGITIVILRNIQERRNELALLSATGYSYGQILMVVLVEQAFILGIGLTAGIAASLMAMWPALRAPGVHPPWGTLTLLICGMLLFQILWILLATRLALRAPLLSALRNQ